MFWSKKKPVEPECNDDGTIEGIARAEDTLGHYINPSLRTMFDHLLLACGLSEKAGSLSVPKASNSMMGDIHKDHIATKVLLGSISDAAMALHLWALERIPSATGDDND